MSIQVNSGAVQLHTINEFLSVTGETPTTNGLHVFSKDHRGGEVPLQAPFRSDYFSVFVINDGELRVKINLFEYRLRKNDLLIVSPNAIRQFVGPECSFSMAGIIFTTDFLSQTGIYKKHIEPFDFFAAHGKPNLQLSGEDAATLSAVIKILHQKNATRHENSFGAEIVQHYFTAFMYELGSMHRKYNAHIKIKLTRKEDLAMRFMKQLSAHFKEERSVQFYADLLYVTPKYLTQAVKEITGKTAGQFIDEMVIMEAKVLLGDPSFSVAQVAESLFFSDQFFFSKFFKNHTGSTPTEYRRAV